MRFALGLGGLATAVQLTSCASLFAPSPPADPQGLASADSLIVDPAVARALDVALGAARWRLLRSLDESAAGRYEEARQELDLALHALAAIDDDPGLDSALEEGGARAEVDALGGAVERAYLALLPHLESLSPDSPLTLLLAELAEERLEQLPADAVPLVRIHQLAPQCDLPVDANARVAASIHFFQTRGRQTYIAWHRRSGRYRDLILPILRQQGLPQDLLYLAMIESGFNPRAYSRAQAVGLWQFIRHTGQLEGLRIDPWVDERRDPVKSTRAAVNHLRGLYAEFGDWRLAAAAYNAGRGRVRRAIEAAGSSDFWALDLPRETRNYVPLLMAAAIVAKDPARFGFDSLAVDEPLAWDPVRLSGLVDLKTAARLLGVDLETVRRLNPELRGAHTPHRPREGYLFNVPAGQGAAFLAAYERLPPSQRRGIQEYRVKRGDNLSSIAQAFGVGVSQLAQANHLGNAHLIHPGQTLRVPVAGGPPLPGAEKGPYTVRRGESLWTISRRLGVSVQDLRVWNGLASGAILRPGQRLRVGTAAALTARERGLHAVRQGETLSSIARVHDVDVAQLRQWNGLRGDRIRVGQTLYVSGVQAKGNGRSYTVVRGDTLHGIAHRFGVEAADIARRNHIGLSATLVTGMELRIPDRQQVD